MRLFIFCGLLLGSLPASALEISGVAVEEVLQTVDGPKLYLNGAGIREKFFFDIYIAELYLEYPASTATGVLQERGQKRVVMHFLYDEVTKEKLIDSWNEGFRGNSRADELRKLQSRIDQFNEMFDDVTKGDNIVLDFIPARGTAVIVANEEKGVIGGKDFNDALLRIWLGEEPVDDGLKEKLLGYRK